MNILNVAYPLAPVGPDAVGGAEQIVRQLDSAVVTAGHNSIVIAREGSRVCGHLIATRAPVGPFDDHRRAEAVRCHRAAIEYALQHCDIDIVHLHGIDFLEYLPGTDVPILATLHLPPAWYPKAVFNLCRSNIFLNCVSHNQLRACPPCRYLLGVVENGVEITRGPHARRDFALALGRICPEKGYHLALEAAAKAHVPLLLAGEVYPYPDHQTYFRSQISPRLNGRQRYIGPVGPRRKRRLLSAAHCLLVPSLAPETSSLVAMEALSCGTPVVAFPSGELAEIIEEGTTGFLVSDAEEMAEALEKVHWISAETCVNSARRRFSLDRMVQGYFELYQRITATARVTQALCGAFACEQNRNADGYQASV